MSTITFILQFIASIGSAALVAYGIFKFLGESWLKHRLAKDLEVAKSEISVLAARKLRLHDREYVVFPEVWSKLNKAFASLGAAVNLLKELPVLDQMSDTEFQNWLSRSELLSEREKETLASASDKLAEYSRIVDWRNLLQAYEELLNFHTYFRENRIFLSPDIKAKLDQIDGLIYEAWLDKKFSIEEDDGKEARKLMRDAHEKYKKQIKPVMDEIEDLFQKQIFPQTE